MIVAAAALLIGVLIVMLFCPRRRVASADPALPTRRSGLSVLGLLVSAALALLPPVAPAAAEFTPEQRHAIEAIVQDRKSVV